MNKHAREVMQQQQKKKKIKTGGRTMLMLRLRQEKKGANRKLAEALQVQQVLRRGWRDCNQAH